MIYYYASIYKIQTIPTVQVIFNSVESGTNLNSWKKLSGRCPIQMCILFTTLSPVPIIQCWETSVSSSLSSINDREVRRRNPFLHMMSFYYWNTGHVISMVMKHSAWYYGTMCPNIPRTFSRIFMQLQACQRIATMSDFCPIL